MMREREERERERVNSYLKEILDIAFLFMREGGVVKLVNGDKDKILIKDLRM